MTSVVRKVWCQASSICFTCHLLERQILCHHPPSQARPPYLLIRNPRGGAQNLCFDYSPSNSHAHSNVRTTYQIRFLCWMQNQRESSLVLVRHCTNKMKSLSIVKLKVLYKASAPSRYHYSCRSYGNYLEQAIIICFTPARLRTSEGSQHVVYVLESASNILQVVCIIRTNKMSLGKLVIFHLS